MEGYEFMALSLTRTTKQNVNTASYGYLYSEHSDDESLNDFNREKNVVLNKTVTNLSPVSYTYDVFNATGQGVSGMFRPFRNDVGTLSDPSYKLDNSATKSFGAEFGGGLYFHGGLAYSQVDIATEYGPWRNRKPSEWI